MSSNESTSTPANNKGFDRYFALPLAQKEFLLAFATRRFDLAMDDLEADSKAELWNKVLTLNAAVNADKFCHEGSDAKVDHTIPYKGVMLTGSLTLIWRVYFTVLLDTIMEGFDGMAKEDIVEERASQKSIRDSVLEGLCKDLGLDESDLDMVELAPMPAMASMKLETGGKGDNSEAQSGSSTK